MKVIIVGAGISGQTLAAALAQRRHSMRWRSSAETSVSGWAMR